MTKRDKLIAKIAARPPTAHFSDVQALLEDFGYSLVRIKGSHHIFAKPGAPLLINVPVHDKRVDRVYLADICRKLGIDESAS